MSHCIQWRAQCAIFRIQFTRKIPTAHHSVNELIWCFNGAIVFAWFGVKSISRTSPTN